MKLKFFKLAKKLSLKSTHPQFKLGCVLVKRNAIVSLGFNQIKTHPKSVFHPFNQLHAELDAILTADKRELQGSTLYIYRQHANGTLAISRPCKYCRAALVSVGVKKVYFTDDGGYSYENLDG